MQRKRLGQALQLCDRLIYYRRAPIDNGAFPLSEVGLNAAKRACLALWVSPPQCVAWFSVLRALRTFRAGSVPNSQVITSVLLPKSRTMAQGALQDLSYGQIGIPGAGLGPRSSRESGCASAAWCSGRPRAHRFRSCRGRCGSRCDRSAPSSQARQAAHSSVRGAFSSFTLKKRPGEVILTADGLLSSACCIRALRICMTVCAQS